MKEISRRLSQKGIKLSSVVSNVTSDLAEVSVEKGGIITKIVPSIGNGGRIVKVVTKYAPGVGIVLALSAGQQAYANGGHSREIATAVGRDLAGADLVESGFKVLIVDGGGLVHDYIVKPGGLIAKRSGALTDRERTELVRSTNEWMKSRQNIFEIFDEGPELGDFLDSAIDGVWIWCFGK